MSLIYKKTAHLYVIAVTDLKTSGFFNESPQAAIGLMARFVFALMLHWLTIYGGCVNPLIPTPRLSAMFWPA
ncbi:hypothetical protein vBVnaSL3_22 [Vibrio phage vB_VnaS-L3]|nr:hypothetical protein vBVnaSL3_22 [Vibrio phage vB_VnaS-L3]